MQVWRGWLRAGYVGGQSCGYDALCPLGDRSYYGHGKPMEATPTQIINYFSGFKQNLIPLFQRPYTWTERQWRTLWEDIVAFYGRDEVGAKSTHFMGAVVTMPARSVPVGVSKFLVIDGQQRLTTVATLLCAIRDDLGTEDQVPKRRIQNHYLTNDGFEGLDFFKLLPTQGDRAAYPSVPI